MIYKKANIPEAMKYLGTDAGGNAQMLRVASGTITIEPGSDKSKLIQAEILKHPTALFFRAKAIKADEPNSNGDYFSEAELKRAYKSFEGVPFFTNHDNQNVENARGKIIFAEWVPEEKSIYTISFVDREAYPHICRSIEEEYITGVSMGCSVEYSVCNICGNKAEKTDDYCSHIRERKGRTFSGRAKNVVTGEIRDFNKEPVFEYNYGIKFIELSAVVDPACPSCRIQGLIENDEIMKKVANLQNHLYMIKTAAIEKTAGQEEITQLNDILKTLEGISVKLIQNRQQVEVEFASDLVGILSELQTFVDELVGAGYGNVQAIPGVAEAPPADGSSAAAPGAAPDATPGAPPLPPGGLPPEVQPVAAQTPAPAPVGTISGSPTKPRVTAPKMPINAPLRAPLRPKSFDMSKMQRVATNLSNLIENANNTGENDMGKRLTVDAKMKQKKAATEVLSNSWQEKQDFFEYINRVPSIQDNNCKLSVKKRDDSFIIVAETKAGEQAERIWTYETLNEQEKTMITNSPKTAASYFLDRFASNLKTQKGEAVMTNNIREAGAKSVNKTPDVVTEAQLEEKGLYHSRTGTEQEQVTERQLDEKRSGTEAEVITEAQLNGKSNKMHPRTGTEADVVTEAQLEADKGVSPRTGKEADQVTQAQLEPNRTGTDTDVITEKQLNSVDSPWARAAKRSTAMFKSAGDHMKAVIDVMANAVISTGCTPVEASAVAATLVASTKDRYDLGNAILDTSKADDVDYSTRLAYWSKKNIKVAGVGTTEIAQTIVKGLQKVASDVTINPEVVIDALDILSEGTEGVDSISKTVDQKLAAAQTQTIKANSKKEDLRKALKASLVDDAKGAREEERKEVIASVDKSTRESERASWLNTLSKTAKKADTVVETNFSEIGCKSKDEPNFKSVIKSFARGALLSQNVKLAAVTNVTISGDTISIAVQTDAGEQGVEIPMGEGSDLSPAEGETMPEADVAGEGLDAAAPAPAPVPAAPGAAPAPAPAMASVKGGLQKVAQVGGGVPNTPGAVAAPGSPEGGGIPGAAPTDQPLQALTTDEEGSDIPDEIPTAGQQQPLVSICPECGASDVDVTNENGVFKGECAECGAEYEAMIKKEVEFKIIKPTRSTGAEETTGAPETPEVPALPVAAQTSLNKGTIVRMAANHAKHGHVCPACGMKQCKASVEENGHTEYTCPACHTDIQKDVLININSPDESLLRVKWDLIPNLEGCSNCKEAATKFASMIKVQGMMKTASEAKSQFPMANCMERIARQWGGNSVATFGPCKGKPLADCVCGQLERLGLNKVRHLEKLASVYAQPDPMDECIQDQMKNKYARKEAETICNCLKKKFASKEDSNVFLMAFADDIKSGKEKILTANDLDAINSEFASEPAEAPIVEDVDEDIGAPLPEAITEEVADETITIEVSEETAQELADAAQVAIDANKVEEVGSTDTGDMPPAASSEAIPEEAVSDVGGPTNIKENEDMAMAMQTHKIVRIGEEIVKLAATPTKVESIEGNVEAKVPRQEQYLGKEQQADSMINKTPSKPNVPRKDAYMGKEKEADSMINKELKLPDVAVDSSYMGHEQEIQKGMPAINNEIKGTVIATDEKNIKEAKKMKEIDTVEKEVESKVPRKNETLGKEGPKNIDVKLNEPKVPRAKATMGEEGPDNIDVSMDAPDVAIDNGYMGDEKNVQKGMPGINDKYLKNVQQKKDVQLERIAVARRMKAVETAAKLLATKRINEDSYENVVEALSRFEIDKIASVADNMYPRIKREAASQETREVYAGPAIVMESKDIKTANSASAFQKKLENSFTIGSAHFDKSLTQYGEK